jgi:hypothetical protein
VRAGRSLAGRARIGSRLSATLLAGGALAFASACQNPRASTTHSAGPAQTPGVPAPPVTGAAQANATVAKAIPPVAKVGGRQIGADELLARLWLFEHARTREAMEYLVFSELGLLEAERLAVELDPAAVQEEVERALNALREKLGRANPPRTLEDYLRRTLDTTLERFERALRRDAIVKLLMERCMRLWFLEQGSARVRAVEVQGAQALEAVQNGLARGERLADLARAHAAAEREAGGRMLELARSEHNELARLAFATPVGSVGGPLPFEDRQLFLEVESVRPPRPGEYPALAAELEADLRARPVEEFEFAQWRDAMLRRYAVDLAPLLELVGH